MGQLAVTIAGGIVGSFFGMPQLGLMVGGMMGSALFAPTIHGPRLDDLTVTASTYGNEIPRLYGTMRLAGNVIWSAGIKEHKKKKKAGKGGPKQVTYTYTCSFAVAFCQGPVQKVLRLWADSKVIEVNGFADRTAMEQVLDRISIQKFGAKGGVKARFYSGDEGQLPDSVIEQTLGVGNAPAYRGLCYVVFENLPLEDYGNRIPSITAELTASVAQELKTKVFTSTGGGPPEGYSKFIDWENRRAVNTGGNSMITYNLDTGEELYRFAGGGGAGAENMGAFGGPVVKRIGASNTQAAVVAYPTTGVSRVIGAATRGLNYGAFGWDTSDFGAETQHSNWNTAEPQKWGFPFSAKMWTFPVAMVGGFKYAIIAQAGTTMHVVDEYGGYYHAFHGPFECADYILGTVGTSTEVWGWANAVGGVSGVSGQGIGLVRYTIGSYATYPTGEPGNWEMEKGAISYRTVQVMRDGIDATYLSYHMAADRALYSPSDNSFVFAGSFNKPGKASVRFFGKYLLDEKKWAYCRTGAAWFRPTGSSWSMSNHRDKSIGYLTTNERLQIVDLSDGSPQFDIYNGVGNYNVAGTSWDADSQTIVWSRSFGDFVRMGVGFFGSALSIASVVTDICERTGLLTADDLDTSEIGDDTITGFIMSRGTAKGSLQILSSAYLFDGVESDFKLKFRKRGGAPSKTITQERLGWVGEGKLFSETRTQEVELPARLTVAFRDPARDYQTGTQHAKRLIGPVATAFTRAETQMEFAMAFTATQAKQLADKLMKAVWRNRTAIELNLPWEFVTLDPADVITLSLDDGTVFHLRMTQMDQGADGTIKATLTTESQTSYISTEVASDPHSFITQPLKSNMPVKLLVMNTPLLRDEDDTQGVRSILYIAAYQESNAAFAGSVIMESTTDLEYDEIEFVSDDPYTGFVMKTLDPTLAWGSTDVESELIVKMWNMNEDVTLSSISYEELLAGGNAALCGEEIIQFQNATLVGTDTYKLTNILRARRGTNPHVNDHIVGERFVMLDPAYISTHPRGPADFNTRRYYKAVRIGQIAEDTQGTEMQLEANDLKPYTPENVKIEEADPDVTISWSRRSRISAPLVDKSGEIHYKEGLGLLASFGYRLHKDRDLEDSPWNSYTPDTPTGRVPFYDTTNSLQPFELTLPITDVITGTSGSFVLELWENGFVEGFHKIVQFTRLSSGEWNTTELY